MSDLWIFGYGSLIWKQNFPFSEQVVCTARGYHRVFFQGSTDHRGVPGKPGRVVTLVQAQGDSGSSSTPPMTVAGVAFRIPAGHEDETLAALDIRERGGYDRVMLPVFHPETGDELPMKCLCYIANPKNDEYLGHASDEDIARQICESAGPSGPNIDYLVNLAHGLRALGVVDEHVFNIESHALRIKASKDAIDV